MVRSCEDTKSKKSSRPSRAERDQNRLKEKKLKGVDKGGRTRAAKSAFKAVARMEGLSEKDVQMALKKQIQKSKIPKKIVSGNKRIYSGLSRSFEKDFSAKWWKKHKSATCFKCGIALTPDNRSIDHKKPWSKYKLSVDTQIVCSGGTHYEVVLSQDFHDHFQDPDNLQPACQSCNSSKGGTKGDDGIGPRKLALKDQTCPGAGCKLPKAV